MKDLAGFRLLLVVVGLMFTAAIIGGAAATKIVVGQIAASSTVGQVITTTATGVVGWATPASVTLPNFSDAEIVTVTSGVATLMHSPVGTSLILVRNGVVQQGAGNDYTLSGATVTFTAGSTPETGDVVLAWYRY